MRRMLEAGVEPERPATRMFNATRPDEHVVAGTVATIAARVDAEEVVVGPCLVLIGEVLRLQGIRHEFAEEDVPSAEVEPRARAGSLRIGPPCPDRDVAAEA